MPQFLIDHLEGCTPAKQCASCRAMTLLKSQLAPGKYAEFVGILEKASGGRITVKTLLTTPWSEILKEQSTRTKICLRNDNLATMGDVVRRSRQAMLRTPNFGKKSMRELEDELAKHGLHFGMDVPNDPPAEETKITE